MVTNFFQILENDNEGTSLYVNDNTTLRKFAGYQDVNLKILEKISDVRINLRGNLITLKGKSEKVKIVVKTIDMLLRKTEAKNNLEEEDIKSFYSFEQKESSFNNDISIKTPKKSVFPRTEKQKNYVNYLNQNNIVFSLGPAGTGKTYLSVAVAVSKLISGETKKIILSRPAVEAGENLGFLPGDLKEKLDPYLQPLYDALRDMIPAEKLKEYVENKVIEIAPLAFMRGRTLDRAFVILDESQNATRQQIKMFLTRMGKSAKFIITGDQTQIDLPNKQPSGLLHALSVLKGVKGIEIVKLDDKDVIRHELVRKIIKAYKQNDNKNE